MFYAALEVYIRPSRSFILAIVQEQSAPSRNFNSISAKFSLADQNQILMAYYSRGSAIILSLAEETSLVPKFLNFMTFSLLCARILSLFR